LYKFTGYEAERLMEEFTIWIYNKTL